MIDLHSGGNDRLDASGKLAAADVCFCGVAGVIVCEIKTRELFSKRLALFVDELNLRVDGADDLLVGQHGGPLRPVGFFLVYDFKREAVGKIVDGDEPDLAGEIIRHAVENPVIDLVFPVFRRGNARADFTARACFAGNGVRIVVAERETVEGLPGGTAVPVEQPDRSVDGGNRQRIHDERSAPGLGGGRRALRGHGRHDSIAACLKDEGNGIIPRRDAFAVNFPVIRRGAIRQRGKRRQRRRFGERQLRLAVDGCVLHGHGEGGRA